MPAAQLFGLPAAITGRRCVPRRAAPARVLLGAGGVANAAQRRVPFRLSLRREEPRTMINARPGDDSITREELGVGRRRWRRPPAAGWEAALDRAIRTLIDLRNDRERLVAAAN